MTYPKLRKIEVEWDDSASSGGWATIDDYHKKQAWPCRTCGYLLSKDDKKLIILQTISLTGNVTDAITIPRSCVKRMKYVIGGLQ